MTLSKLSSAAVGIIAALSTISGVQASTLVSQPLDNSVQAVNAGYNQQIADAFSIATGGIISSVSWDGFYSLGSVSNFQIVFYQNNSGKPGTALYTISGITPTQADTGYKKLGYTVYQFDYTLPTSFDAAAGTTYFFSVYEQASSYNFIWSGSAMNAGSVFNLNGSGWFSLQEGQAFTLSGTATPLPAALPLFATGLGALGLLGWRRKRKAQAAA